jgi:hypothetical protein
MEKRDKTMKEETTRSEDTLIYKYGVKENILKGLGIVSILGVIGFTALQGYNKLKDLKKIKEELDISLDEKSAL